MQTSLIPETPVQSALDHRLEETKQQQKFFKFTLPIALILHLGAIAGFANISRHIAIDPAQDEVEIVADDQLEPKPDPTQAIDSNGQSGDLAGGGGGSSRFSLSQTAGGTTDGNNIAALGNPFTTTPTEAVPQVQPEMPTMPVESVPENAIEPEQKTPIEKPPEKNKETSSNISKTDEKSTQNPPTTPTPTNPGQLNGKEEGKGTKGDPNGGKLNPNAAAGEGRSGGSGTGKGDNSGSGTNSSGKQPGISGGSNVTPILSKPQSQSESQPQAKITPQLIQKKQARKCIENCGLNEYLGSEGSLRIRQEIGKDGKVNPILVQTSGDPELDRKALEAIKNRRYETSESDTTSNIRVTSQQEGSDFARQQDDRRQRRQIEQDAIDRERAIQEQETRKSEPVAKPVAPAPTEPIPEPVAPITPPPPASEPIAAPIAPPAPDPIAPPASEPIAEPVAPSAPEPIAEPAPVAPDPNPLP